MICLKKIAFFRVLGVVTQWHHHHSFGGDQATAHVVGMRDADVREEVTQTDRGSGKAAAVALSIVPLRKFLTDPVGGSRRGEGSGHRRTKTLLAGENGLTDIPRPKDLSTLR